MTNKVTTVRFHIGGDDEIKTEHNRREESTIKWEQHIDMEGKHEVLRDMSIEETYEELFGRAIEEYDAKQKRRDRRIGGVHEYMEQVRADSRGRVNHKTRTKGKNLAYEVIVGVGSVKPEFDETTGRMKRDKDGNILTPFLVPDDTEYGKDVIQLEQRMAELAAADAARTKKHHERHAAAPERP